MIVTIGKSRIAISKNCTLTADSFLIVQGTLQIHTSAFAILKKIPQRKRSEFLIKLIVSKYVDSEVPTMNQLLLKGLIQSSITLYPENSPPLLPEEGDIYYSTIDKKIHMYLRESWGILEQNYEN